MSENDKTKAAFGDVEIDFTQHLLNSTLSFEHENTFGENGINTEKAEFTTSEVLAKFLKEQKVVMAPGEEETILAKINEMLPQLFNASITPLPIKVTKSVIGTRPFNSSALIGSEHVGTPEIRTGLEDLGETVKFSGNLEELKGKLSYTDMHSSIHPEHDETNNNLGVVPNVLTSDTWEIEFSGDSRNYKVSNGPKLLQVPLALGLTSFTRAEEGLKNIPVEKLFEVGEIEALTGANINLSLEKNDSTMTITASATLAHETGDHAQNAEEIMATGETYQLFAGNPPESQTGVQVLSQVEPLATNQTGVFTNLAEGDYYVVAYSNASRNFGTGAPTTSGVITLVSNDDNGGINEGDSPSTERVITETTDDQRILPRTGGENNIETNIVGGGTLAIAAALIALKKQKKRSE